ncbi:MAG: NAD(P)-dependent oxidoreductase [bacterium]|nr:NAD(P)-dependent oxidoreductase [bacterium]
MDFKNKDVLVAGGTGLIGQHLVILLLEAGANVRVVSMDHPSRANPHTEFRMMNLLDPGACRDACFGMDYVFNLLCSKGSPQLVREKPATMFDHNALLDMNMLRAARESCSEGILIASSLAVYAPSPVFDEDDIGPAPSRNDWYPGWAKRMGEMQAQAYQEQYPEFRISIVRPANTYGPWDDFASPAAMVVPSFIRRIEGGEDPFVLRGQPDAIRDIVYAKDVARGMFMAAEQEVVGGPINLGTGVGVSILGLIKTVIDVSGRDVQVILGDQQVSTGDSKRVLLIHRARKMGWKPEVSLRDGIRETFDWYRSHKKDKSRYDPFASL